VRVIVSVGSPDPIPQNAGPGQPPPFLPARPNGQGDLAGTKEALELLNINQAVGDYLKIVDKDIGFP
jgi:hypothetical protein